MRQVPDSYLIETYWLPIDFAWYRVNIRLPVILLGTYSHTSHIGRQPDIYHLIFKCEWQPGVEKTRDRRLKTEDRRPQAFRLSTTTVQFVAFASTWMTSCAPVVGKLEKLVFVSVSPEAGAKKTTGGTGTSGYLLALGNLRTRKLGNWRTGEQKNWRTTTEDQEQPERLGQQMSATVLARTCSPVYTELLKRTAQKRKEYNWTELNWTENT